jgi:hypothetical protein
MNFTIDNITLTIETERNGIRLKTDIENWFIPNQTIVETETIIKKNYRIVKEHYQSKIGEYITESDLEFVSFNIVLHYFQMYNHWRTLYKREKNRNLTFVEKDFEHISTSYHIIDSFKRKYPENYSEKCESMLGMNKEQFTEFEKKKKQFDNK